MNTIKFRITHFPSNDINEFELKESEAVISKDVVIRNFNGEIKTISYTSSDKYKISIISSEGTPEIGIFKEHILQNQKLGDFLKKKRKLDKDYNSLIGMCFSINGNLYIFKNVKEYNRIELYVFFNSWDGEVKAREFDDKFDSLKGLRPFNGKLNESYNKNPYKRTMTKATFLKHSKLVTKYNMEEFRETLLLKANEYIQQSPYRNF